MRNKGPSRGYRTKVDCHEYRHHMNALCIVCMWKVPSILSKVRACKYVSQRRLRCHLLASFYVFFCALWLWLTIKTGTFSQILCYLHMGRQQRTQHLNKSDGWKERYFFIACGPETLLLNNCRIIMAWAVLPRGHPVLFLSVWSLLIVPDSSERFSVQLDVEEVVSLKPVMLRESQTLCCVNYESFS